MKLEMWWVWMALASIFIMGEVLRQGSFFLWIGFGAALSGILALLDIPAPGQIAVFINISGILIVLERRFSERYTFKKPIKYFQGTGEMPGNDGNLLSDNEAVFQNVIRKMGPGWEIRYGGKSYTVKHSTGLIHIRNLIIKRGDWIHCSELKRLSSEDASEVRYEPYMAMTKEQLEVENLRLDSERNPEDIIERLSLEKIKKLGYALDSSNPNI